MSGFWVCLGSFSATDRIRDKRLREAFPPVTPMLLAWPQACSKELLSSRVEVLPWRRIKDLSQNSTVCLEGLSLKESTVQSP